MKDKILEMEKYAEEENVPIIEKQSIAYIMKYIQDNNIKSIAIYYDYEGIAKWCTGEWRANKPGTIAYRDFYEKISEDIDITFVKVQGHSNDKYNDMADALAKDALGI